MGCLGYGLHGHGGEEEGEHAADKQADDDMGVEDIYGGKLHCLCIGHKQGQGGQRRRTDGKPLTDGSGGVAHGIQLIGDFTHGFVQSGHLRDSACIVRNGSVGVNGNRDSCGGKHPHSCQGNSVKSHKAVGYKDADAHQKDGDSR